MQRRDFLGASCLAGAAALGTMTGAAGVAGAGEASKKQILELRVYRFDDAAARQRLEKFLAEVAIPAWNRIGIKPVGAFIPADEKLVDLYVLLPHGSAESFATSASRLWADAEYQKAGEAVLNVAKDAPAYKRVESSVMIAFDGVPQVEVPSKKDTRVLQLRIYESHSDVKAKKKVEMFNAGGELALFRRCGMGPVFFGETIAGLKMPNLTYMVGFDDPDAQKAGWDKFMKDPEWLKLKDDPQYKDTVSNITNIVMKPAAGSQI